MPHSSLFRRFLRNENGATAVEFALIASMCLLMFMGITVLGLDEWRRGMIEDCTALGISYERSNTNADNSNRLAVAQNTIRTCLDALPQGNRIQITLTSGAAGLLQINAIDLSPCNIPLICNLIAPNGTRELRSTVVVEEPPSAEPCAAATVFWNASGGITSAAATATDCGALNVPSLAAGATLDVASNSSFGDATGHATVLCFDGRLEVTNAVCEPGCLPETAAAGWGAGCNGNQYSFNWSDPYNSLNLYSAGHTTPKNIGPGLDSLYDQVVTNHNGAGQFSGGRGLFNTGTTTRINNAAGYTGSITKRCVAGTWVVVSEVCTPDGTSSSGGATSSTSGGTTTTSGGTTTTSGGTTTSSGGTTTTSGGEPPPSVNANWQQRCASEGVCEVKCIGSDCTAGSTDWARATYCDASCKTQTPNEPSCDGPTKTGCYFISAGGYYTESDGRQGSYNYTFDSCGKMISQGGSCAVQQECTPTTPTPPHINGGSYQNSYCVGSDWVTFNWCGAEIARQPNSGNCGGSSSGGGSGSSSSGSGSSSGGDSGNSDPGGCRASGWSGAVLCATGQWACVNDSLQTTADASCGVVPSSSSSSSSTGGGSTGCTPSPADACVGNMMRHYLGGCTEDGYRDFYNPSCDSNSGTKPPCDTYTGYGCNPGSSSTGGGKVEGNNGFGWGSEPSGGIGGSGGVATQNSWGSYGEDPNYGTPDNGYVSQQL